MSWSNIWSEVLEALRSSDSRSEALEKVQALRDTPTTWDALGRAGRRRGISVSDLLSRETGRSHFVIPDTQVEPGVPIDHFRWIGRAIASLQPDVLIHLGDHWDMPSLSTYETAAKKSSRGLVKVNDIEAGNKALEMLEEEMAKANFVPQLKIFLEGNHDGFAPGGRPARYLSDNPTDKGLIRKDQFADSWLGWNRVDFNSSIVIDGIRYSHLFPYSARGTVTMSSTRTGASSPDVQLQALMQSCTAGHKQGLDWCMRFTPEGTYRSVIAGSCYQHHPEYLGPADYWRGCLFKEDVRVNNPNHYEMTELSLEKLKRRFG